MKLVGTKTDTIEGCDELIDFLLSTLRAAHELRAGYVVTDRLLATFKVDEHEGQS